MSVETYLKEHTDNQRGVNIDMILAHSGLSEGEAVIELGALLKVGTVYIPAKGSGNCYHYKQEKRGWLLKVEAKARAANG